MLLRRLLFGLSCLQTAAGCMNTDPDANLFFDLLGIPSLREYLGGDIEIDFGTLNPLIRLPNPFGEFKVRYPCELNCAHFDAHGSWPCRWRNELSAAADCQSAQCSTDQLDWVRAKNSWGVEEGITIFGTEKTATRYYILAGTQERQHPTAAALLTSDPIQCQEGDGFLQFRYWTSPRTTLRVCIRMVGSPTIRSYSWCSAEISRGDPGPATVRLPGSVMADFEIVIEAANFTFEGFGKQGGMVILDDLRYWAAAIYNCRDVPHIEPIPQSSCGAVRCSFAEEDKCSHQLGGFRRADDTDIPHPRGLPKALPYPANWSGDPERFAVASHSAVLAFRDVELPRAVAVEFCAAAIGDGALELWATLRGFGKQRFGEFGDSEICRLWATAERAPRLHSATTKAMGMGKRRLRRDAADIGDSPSAPSWYSSARRRSRGHFVNRTEPPRFSRIPTASRIADGIKTAIPIGRRFPTRQSFDRRVARLRDWLFGDLFASASRDEPKWAMSSLRSAADTAVAESETPLSESSPSPSSDSESPSPNWETGGDVVEDVVVAEAAWECPRIHLHPGFYDSLEFVAVFGSAPSERPSTEPRRRGDSRRRSAGAVALGAIRLVGTNGELADPCALPFDPFADPPPHPSMCGVDCSLGCGCERAKAATGCVEATASATSSPVDPFGSVAAPNFGGQSVEMAGAVGKPETLSPFGSMGSVGSDGKPELINPFPPMESLPNPMESMKSPNPLAAAMEALSATATRPIAQNRGVGDSWLGMDLSPDAATPSPLEAIFAPLKFGSVAPNSLPPNLFPTFPPSGAEVVLVDGSSRPATTEPTFIPNRLRPLPERFPFLSGLQNLGSATGGDANTSDGGENSSLNWNSNESDIGGDLVGDGDPETASAKRAEATKSRAAATPITTVPRRPNSTADSESTAVATTATAPTVNSTSIAATTAADFIALNSTATSAIPATSATAPNAEPLWPLFTDVADRLPTDAEISFGGIGDNDSVSGEVKWKFFGPKGSEEEPTAESGEFGEDLSDVAPFDADPTAFEVEEAKRFQLATTTDSDAVSTTSALPVIGAMSSTAAAEANSTAISSGIPVRNPVATTSQAIATTPPEATAVAEMVTSATTQQPTGSPTSPISTPAAPVQLISVDSSPYEPPPTSPAPTTTAVTPQSPAAPPIAATTTTATPKPSRRPFLGNVAIMQMQVITTTPHDDSIFPNEIAETDTNAEEHFSGVHLPIAALRFPTAPPNRIHLATRPRRKPTSVF